MESYEDDQKQKALEHKYDCLVFDIDDTLYPSSSGLSVHVTQNIQEYMIKKLGIEESKVPDMCASLYKYYGTTMAGLRAIGYKFDYDDFHSFVHGRLPYQKLRPDPVLRNILLNVPVRKIVLTNADKAHASRVLSRLELEDCFESIICFETLNEVDKGNVPVDGDDTEVFDIDEYCLCSLMIASVTYRMENDWVSTLFGWAHRTEGVDCALESIHNIKEALPELWEDNDKSEGIKYSKKVAIETSVKA
uniref:Uncharacterized protein n=1 Tax=Salix viminalis TaxID=40686 RepID=A0A6N2LGJ7_SALVM